MQLEVVRVELRKDTRLGSRHSTTNNPIWHVNTFQAGETDTYYQNPHPSVTFFEDYVAEYSALDVVFIAVQ